MGVLNEGIVTGLPLTAYQVNNCHFLRCASNVVSKVSYQKDHVIVNLYDALSRFKPVVPKDQVKIAFVPVIDNENASDLLKPETVAKMYKTVQKH